jgi:hypothetical protein
MTRRSAAVSTYWWKLATLSLRNRHTWQTWTSKRRRVGL